MQEPDQHASPIKNWKQLLVIVGLAFAVPIVVAVLISQWVTGGMKGVNESQEDVIRRIMPVGEVELAASTTAFAPVTVSASSERTGEEVVSAVCGKCHMTGEHGAPKIGDRDAWRQRAKTGYKGVLKSALRGHAGMPARGGMADLSDAEIGRAVEYMMNSGADKPVVAATAAAPVAATAPAATASTATTPAASAGAAEGKKVYDATCVVCHGAGIAGAPKVGDKAAWAPRVAQGVNVLFAHALNGFKAMPPKGGNKALTDAQLRAAIDYMVAASK